MTCTHPSVKQNKSTASSACSFYYLFLASRRVYKTAPYCISWSYPLPAFISVSRLSFRRHDAAPLFAKPRQKSVAKYAVTSKVLSLSLPPHLSIAASLSRSHSLVSPHLSFSFPLPSHSKLKSNRLSQRKYRPCQRIHWICCTIDPLEASWGWEWDEGGLEGWRYGRVRRTGREG